MSCIIQAAFARPSAGGFRQFWGQKRRLERVKGIEPSYSAWKAAALPLSYTRADLLALIVVGEVGLEPTKA
jgi:hypothetical protein